MSVAQNQNFLACTDDADFRRKYAITAACALGSVIIAPAILFLGYLTQTMKRATIGRKGLPEWTLAGLQDMAMQGGVALLSLVYLLPSALLTAISVLPSLSGNNSFLSVSALISRFISFGALLAFIVGLAFTVSALHLYLTKGKVSELFQVKSIYQKVMSNKAELGALIVVAAIAIAAISFVSWLLSWFGIYVSFIASVIGQTFISLVVFYNSGRILGPTSMEEPEALVEAEPQPALSSSSQTTEFPSDDDDAWIPT